MQILFRIHFFILVLFYITPTVFADSIVFGKPAYQLHFKNGEDAIKPWRPVKTTREAEYVYAWERWLVKETHYFYEGRTESLEIYDNNGEKIAVVPQKSGPFVFSRSGRTILFCENSEIHHTNDTTAILYSIDGKILKKFPAKVWSRDCGVVGYGEVYWQRFTVMKKFMVGPSSIIVFRDSNGNKLKEVKQEKAGVVELNYGNRKFNIYFSPPRIPG